MRIFLAIIFVVLSGVNLRAGTIVVQGEGHVHHPPSYVLLDLSFREEGQNAGMILCALRSRVDAAVLAFERNGIPKKHIKTRRFNVYLDQNFQAKPAKNRAIPRKRCCPFDKTISINLGFCWMLHPLQM